MTSTSPRLTTSRSHPWTPRPATLRRHKAQLAIGRVLWSWMERAAQRRALANLDDYLLRDVGLTREDSARASARPFWRP